MLFRVGAAANIPITALSIRRYNQTDDNLRSMYTIKVSCLEAPNASKPRPHIYVQNITAPHFLSSVQEATQGGTSSNGAWPPFLPSSADSTLVLDIHKRYSVLLRLDKPYIPCCTNKHLTGHVVSDGAEELYTCQDAQKLGRIHKQTAVCVRGTRMGDLDLEVFVTLC